ncbi:MAG: diaminobutyrate acetyltransferase [Alphaproteobacteria bacterium]|nr:diaminobutyrate acetyltransferase [Alphaproteobacteria bacterium]
MAISETCSRGSAAPLSARYTFRQPSADDGEAIWRLIASCPPLDENSLYCNVLQCSHFSGTCVVAERDGKPQGWLSAYIPPEEPNTIFVWQIAVHENARGEGLGRQLIAHLLARPRIRHMNYLKATVTPQNKASWALFRSVAKERNARITSEEWLQRDRHFGGRHESEFLISIGPFGAALAH